MQNTKLKNALLSMGFSEKESVVYLTLLNLGKATVSEVARRAGINRTTGYDILNKLITSGLATLSGKKPKQEYIAEPPDKIILYLEKKIQNDKENLSIAKELIPEFNSLHNIGKRPQVKFYEGKEGLEHVYEDTLTSHETILAFAEVENMHKALPNYFPKYYKRRAQKKIHINAILPATETSIERSRHDRDEERTSSLVPMEKFYFSPEINIYDNKIMIASWKEKLGIIIESHEIADAMKKIFTLAWEGSKKYNEEIKEKI